MNSQERYRSTLRGMTPSPAWRKDTLEAMKAAQGKKVRLRRRPLVFAATAAALVLGVGLGAWWANRTGTDPNDPGVARTPEPVVTPTPQEGWNDVFSIVTDPDQLFGSNPTDGQLDHMPSRLPVFSNPIPTEEDQQDLLSHWARALDLTLEETWWTPGGGENSMAREPVLEGSCTDGTQMQLLGTTSITLRSAPDPEALEQAAIDRLLADHTSPILSGWETQQETITTYDFTGEAHTTRTTFLAFPDSSVPEQLFTYSFNRIEATDDSLTIHLPYPNRQNGYFLRPAEDAVASFRSGDYWGSDYTAYPGEAEILQVTLEYDTGPGQPYFHPVYRILFTQDYWDEVIADRMFDGVDPSPFTGVGIAYVPAIEPESLDEAPYRRYFNDGLAHFTPEDFP